ncbi:hypothetical protein [Desulfoluna sp.]|uniref:hypothetical protein n=1 Tax=Desulfoluna sp. TaxID=2045199 RepID=UPI0026094376|nr:hypothetical protein [Desulfoluna sp.]
MASSAHDLVLSFYTRFTSRIAISVGYGPGLEEIFPFVFEDCGGTAIGIIALAVMDLNEREVVHIYHLGALTPGKGQGTTMIKELCRVATQCQVPLSLSPIHCPNGNPLWLDDKGLALWYRRFGFRGAAHLVREPGALPPSMTCTRRGSATTNSEQRRRSIIRRDKSLNLPRID